MKKKNIFLATLTVSTILGMAYGASMKGNLFPNINVTASDVNSLILSSAHPVSEGFTYTQSGNKIWVKGDSSSGVTWNNGSNKVAISKNGYIQTLSVLHGIQTVTVSLSSGSIELFHGYVEPKDLDTPMYETGHTFTSSNTYTFSGNLPNRIRLKAKEAAVINSIVITFDCTTASVDNEQEDLDNGLENSFIDSGTIGRYANTTYVVGEDNTVNSDSKRALKISFNGTTNNYVALDTARNFNNQLTSEPLSLKKSIVTFKAKFSSDVSDYEMQINPIGKNWEHPGYQKMNRSFYEENGWYSYSFNMNQIDFSGCEEVIRINIKPTGINETNKSTAYVILDDVQIKPYVFNYSQRYESMDQGLENMDQDIGWENTYIDYDNLETFGRKSTNSLVARPGYRNKDYSHKWFVSLNPQECIKYFDNTGIDFSSGIFSFNYKPINTLNPNQFILHILKDWDHTSNHTLTGTYIRDGWYKAELDLSTLSYDVGEMPIRINFCFDVDNNNLLTSKMYLDNIKITSTTQESVSEGLENMVRDTGWEEVNASVDRNFTASETSSNSLKLRFNSAKTITNSNRGFVVLSPQGQNMTISGTHGVLTAKFLFSSEFTQRTIRLVLVDSGWKAQRYNVSVSPLGNGWYLLNIDLSNLPTPVSGDSGYTGDQLIRIGFGFVEITDINKTNATVWMDDVFYNDLSDITTNTSATIWQAFNTENVLQRDSVTSGRQVNSANPLTFSDLKNGIDSTQLMIKANTQIDSYSFKPGCLYSEDGTSLDPSFFEVLVEQYVYIGTDSAEKNGSRYGWRGAGWYPDALVPIDKIIEHGENTINSSYQQGLWINCHIPGDQKAGLYRGNGVLTLNGKEYNVPMSVQVYDAYLSDKNNARTMFLLWDDQTQIGETPSRTDHVMYQRYYDFILDRRLCPGNNRNWSSSSSVEAFAEDVAKYLANNDRINNYRIPVSNTYESVFSYLEALVDKNIEVWDEGNHVNFFEKVALYINDEPSAPQKDPNSTAGKESVEQWQRCKDAQTYMHTAINVLSARLDGYPEIKNGLTTIRNVVPFNVPYANISGARYYSGGYKYYPNYLTDEYLDSPCPTFDYLDNPTERSNYFEKFDQVWFYGCLLPNLPYPGFHVDNKLLNQRGIAWMQYAYNIDGQVYYCCNNYSRRDTNETVYNDVWEDPYTMGMSCGDGRLVYPGIKYGIYGPITTMRLENIRNSFEDYEYMKMIDARIGKLNSIYDTSYGSCRDLFSSQFTAFFSNGTKIQTTFTSQMLYSYRTQLLQYVDAIY